MNHEKFFTWCRIAVKGIKYRPERDQVHKELYEHLEDRYESFRSRGWEQEEAVDKTIEAMGSAEDLAPQLAKIYNPFWPYMLLVSRIVLIILVVITIIPFALYLHEQFELDTSPYSIREYNVFRDVAYQSESQSAKRMLYLKPGRSVSIDGYTVTATKAAWWRTEYPGGSEEDRFYIYMDVNGLLPWEEINFTAPSRMWAEDSLGNHYYGMYEHAYASESMLIGTAKRSGMFSYTFELMLADYVSQDAEYIDLHYDRDGRDFALRIYLTGGAGIENEE